MNSSRRSLYMPLYGYYPSDPRVRKEVTELLSLDLDIHIVCLNQDQGELPPNVHVHSLMKNVRSNQRESIPNLIFFWFFVLFFLPNRIKALLFMPMISLLFLLLLLLNFSIFVLFSFMIHMNFFLMQLKLN